MILFNEGPGEFGDREADQHRRGRREPHRRWPSATSTATAATTSRLLAENELVFVYQSATGELGEPERVPHTAGNPRMLKLVDLDGDGGDDLVILDGGTDDPIRVRFATDEKKLGPEQRFHVESPRAIAFGQIDGKGGSEILTIENQSGRGKVLTLDESAEDEQNKWGRLIFFRLPPGRRPGPVAGRRRPRRRRQGGRRGHRPGQRPVLVYRQSGRSGLGAGQSFPGPGRRQDVSSWPTSTATARPRSTSSPSRRSRSAGACSRTAG